MSASCLMYIRVLDYKLLNMYVISCKSIVRQILSINQSKKYMIQKYFVFIFVYSYEK